MTDILTGEYQHLLIALFYLVVLGLFLGARYLDKKAGNEGLIMTKSVSVTTIRRK